MSGADLPPALAELMARVERAEASGDDCRLLERMLRAAVDGRPIAEILAANARDRRDAALQAMRRDHFADLAASGAAKAMETRIRRYAASVWPVDRRAKAPPLAGSLHRACFDVLAAADGASPSWRTILRALPRSPLSVANGSGRKGA